MAWTTADIGGGLRGGSAGAGGHGSGGGGEDDGVGAGGDGEGGGGRCQESCGDRRSDGEGTDGGCAGVGDEVGLSANVGAGGEPGGQVGGDSNGVCCTLMTKSVTFGTVMLGAKMATTTTTMATPTATRINVKAACMRRRRQVIIGLNKRCECRSV